jgi:putative oxidoreductase
MLETLFFKFTGAPESIYIFSRMNMEPWWRYGQGSWELIASILLLTPRFAWAGGILTLGALGAAIVSHLTILGIQIQGDRGLLFAMATVAFTSALVVTYLHRDEIPAYEPTSLY